MAQDNFQTPPDPKKGYKDPKMTPKFRLGSRWDSLGFHTSRFTDFQTAPAPVDKLSDPNLTALPTHPGIKYVARALAAIWKGSIFGPSA